MLSAGISPSKQITIPLCGAKYLHGPGFWLERPQGNGVYVFLYFESPSIIHDITGRPSFPRNGAILYAPGFHQWYSSGPSEMNHSWFHCSGDGAADCIARFGLPVNTAFDLGAVSYIVPFIQSVQREQLRRDPDWEDAVSLHSALFFLELSRTILRRNDPLRSAYQMQMRDTLQQVRAAVHADLKHPWTVQEIAKLAHLSPSRLTALYAEFFETSPIEDLIGSRVQQAKTMLEQTLNSVEAIAEACGFGSPAHFSRLFRRRVGYAPRRFRDSVIPPLA